MDTTELLFAIAISILFNGLFLYIIIRSATSAGKRAQYEWAQLQIIAKIAHKQGITSEELKAVFDKIK